MLRTWNLFFVKAPLFSRQAFRHSASRWLTRSLFPQAASAGAGKIATAAASPKAASNDAVSLAPLRGLRPAGPAPGAEAG